MKKVNINKYIDSDKSLSSWMREESKSLLSKRYKQTHMAEDMGVSDAVLSRFLNGHSVNEKFISKWFDFFVTLKSGILE